MIRKALQILIAYLAVSIVVSDVFVLESYKYFERKGHKQLIAALITSDGQVNYYGSVLDICGNAKFNENVDTFSLKSPRDPDLDAEISYSTDNIIIELNTAEYDQFDEFKVGNCDGTHLIWKLATYNDLNKFLTTPIDGGIKFLE
jgi:hypothetical protein